MTAEEIAGTEMVLMATRAILDNGQKELATQKLTLERSRKTGAAKLKEAQN